MSAKEHVFTLGIEEEFQIIDPETRELRSHIQQILEGGKMQLKERVKPEMHQSVVELGTEICHDTASARQQVVQLRRELAMVAGTRRPNDRFRRHASLFSLDGSVDHGRRALRHHRQGYAADCARESHLRAACPRRHSRSGNCNPGHESGALFSAAHLRAFGQLTLLVGREHRFQLLSIANLPALSAHRHSRRVREFIRV